MYLCVRVSVFLLFLLLIYWILGIAQKAWYFFLFHIISTYISSTRLLVFQQQLLGSYEVGTVITMNEAISKLYLTSIVHIFDCLPD